MSRVVSSRVAARLLATRLLATRLLATRLLATRLLATRLLATWFGCGYSPRAPGTVGSLGAVPLHLLLREAPPGVHALAIVLTIGAGTWAAHRYAIERAQSDPQSVVIDEVAGTLLCMGAVRHEAFWLQALALLLFRVFDIWKPGPIRRAEHLSPVGVGIMADDVLAGLCAGALAWGVARLV